MALILLLRDWEKAFRRLAILVLLYSIPAFQAMLPIDDPDIWWHLRTGQWIVEHGRVPTEDPFSTYGMGKPWIAYSWLFEILVYLVFRNLGLNRNPSLCRCDVAVDCSSSASFNSAGGIGIFA
jgi:hypothetical protein